VIGGDKKTQFRIRPQTPKLDMILLQKAKRKKLDHIEPLPVRQKSIRKPININKRKIKIKRKDSTKSEKRPEQSDNEEVVKREVVLTQQNFYNQKLDVRLEEKINNVKSDEDEIMETQKQETGVLFGAAYENTYIDILENEGIVNDTEINERLLEICLGMSKEGLKEMDKIEIVVDTTNTHMQHVGEVLINLTNLRLNDSVIPSIRDLGTSFKSLQVLSISR
jgi:hypothetical protein